MSRCHRLIPLSIDCTLALACALPTGAQANGELADLAFLDGGQPRRVAAGVLPMAGVDPVGVPAKSTSP